MLQLEAALAHIKNAPADSGVLELIVRRPATGQREVLTEASFDLERSLLGDSWSTRKSPNKECQVTIMNSRAIAAIAGPRDSWPIAGDQLYVDLDLSADNLPPGSQLQIGDVVLEVTAYPHAGCAKFKARFGPDALAFVNSKIGMHLRLRGLNARVIQPGTLRLGDPVRKLPPGHVAA